ncbi:UNVERIFIED_CONTAM: hypothetical protein GTU68_045826 [Idotea baltica]|nr:hypothetical protein [Idotea baltica]
MLIASLLTSKKVTYSNVPELSDVNSTLRLLEQFGATQASYSLIKSMRASFWILGPLLARGGAARVALPGGDIIGARPVDLHLSALKEMGEAATYVLAAIITKGEVLVKGFNPNHFGKFLELLREMNVNFEVFKDALLVKENKEFKGINIKTAPFPGLATDIQPLLMAALTFAKGESTVEENIFEGRFAHVAELCRMGAQIEVFNRTAKITGVKSLSAAPVEGNDIRAAAAMIIAALGAKGKSQIFEPQHVRRGYSNIEQKLNNLGAKVGVRQKDAEDFILTGC